MSSRETANTLWLTLLIFSAFPTKISGNNQDTVSTVVAANQNPAVARHSPDIYPDVVLKGLIVVKIKTVAYIRELSDREKDLTKRLVALCEREMNKLFQSIKGKQTAKIESFRRGRWSTMIVLMNLDSTGNGNVSEINEVINKKIKIPGKFINYDVERRMVRFRSYGVCCQPKVHYSFGSISGNAVYDTSGFDNNGVLHGLSESHNRGKYGRAIKFKNGYVSLKSFKRPKVPTGTNSIAVIFWIKILNPRANSIIFRCYHNGSVIQLSLDRGFLKWQYIARDETTAFQLKHRRLLRSRHWTHVAGIYDPYARTAKLYVDAKLVRRSAVRKDVVKWKFASLMRFGLMSSEGFLDELYVYDCVLGEDIIKNIRGNSLRKEKCSPRGKNQYLIRIILVSTNNSRSSKNNEITELVESEIEKMFDGISGEQKVQFVGYRQADGDSIMVDYSLQSIGNSNAKYLAGVLQPAITSGRIGGVNLASNVVYFVAISGKSVCLSSEMKCNDGQCVNKLWKCDGEINCADGSDEINCGKTIDMNCNEKEYQCKTPRILGINDCVSSNFRCDGQLDCHDDSDEHSCVPPRLITAPRSLIILAEGETASCKCAASGVPVPKVSWRYRGKEVLSKKGEISVTSVSGRGTLTIFNVARVDSGDYICKVMDNRVTKIIAPSCTITVRAFGNVCSRPYFNSAAQTSSDCLRCFCHDKTDRCRSAKLYRSTISSRWGCANCKDEAPSLVDENGRTLGSLTERDLRAAEATSYYWQLPKKYVGNKLASYGGRLRFLRDSESLQGWPARIRRNTGGNPEREPNGLRIHPTVENYAPERNHGSWFNRSDRKPHANDVPLVKGPPSHRHDFGGDNAMHGPRILTGQNVAVIVGNDGTHLFSTKPHYLNDSSVEIRMNEESWEESGQLKTTSRTKLMRVLTDVRHIFINARGPEASASSLVSVSLDTAIEQERENEEFTLVERCACPLGYKGLSCEKCTGGYFRSKQTNRCVKCHCFNHSTTCNLNTGECENCLHGTKGANCQYCKGGSYGDATIGTTNDCKPCACPLEDSTNQFSKFCYLHVDGKQTCSHCQKGYTGRNCERCAEGYEGNPLVVGGNCYKVGNFTRCDMSGSVSQNVTERGEITCTCKTNVVGSTCDQCRSGTFNLQVSNPSGCERCFCSGASYVCANLIGSRITINSAFQNDRFHLMSFDRTMSAPHTVSDRNGEAYLRKIFLQGESFNKVLYWNLPFKFTGSKVASYGGYLEYTVSYTWNDPKKLPRAHDVMLLGKQFGIIYAGRSKEYVNNLRHTYRVSLKEKFWRYSSRTMVSKHVFLLFLSKIERVLILATPKIQMTETRLHDVKLDIAVENTDGSGKPLHSLEKCSCPEGYLGYSCEDCADGFARAGSRIYSHCVKCQCNGHSPRCDKRTRECKNCQHNTGGKHCEKCNPGFYGDATTGSEAACQPCPCPRIHPPNRFSPTCYMGDDDQPVCDRCSEGHEGIRCERCQESYTGNPLVNGDSCKPVTSCGCDPKGSRSKECDPKTKRCLCKKNVQGEKCDECKQGFYNLEKDNEEGCMNCFCMGFNTTCRSKDYYREQIRFPVHSTTLPAGLTIATEDLSEHTTDFVVDVLSKRVRFFTTTWLRKGNIYWTLPPRFLGNQVMSYGGALSFSFSFALPSRGISDIGTAVRIKGTGATLHYRDLERFRANIVNDKNIVFLEKHWKKPDGDTVSRFELMQVLVNIDAIMIRASYSRHALETSIADIKMNVYPKPDQTKAAEVEICDCPFTYYGTSCESCSPGYTRQRRTFEQCVRCQCNLHSVECDEYTGVCKKCADNTVGENCELCSPGSYGDATRGTAQDCKECPCPLLGSSNRFSKTCFLDKDGLPTCDSCQEGYSGRNCDKCSLNYTGNPLTPGGKCFQVPVELIPKVKITPESITLLQGDSARFVCHVTSVRPTQVLWSRENWLQLSSRAIVTGNILSFKSLNISDAGEYVCTASNDIAVRTAKMRLHVKKQQISAVFVTVSPKSRYIPVGGSAKFTCSSKTSSRYSIRWTREHNKAMSASTSVVDGTLTVEDAQLRDGGTYICTGKNALNIDRAIVSLHVGVVVKPQVSASPQRQVVAIADAVTFRCSATGFPAATLRWQREDGRQLPRFIKFLSTVGLFKISAASREDEGKYMCIASNSGGDSVRKVQLLVKGPNSLPKASITPSSLTTEEGKRADFHCQISGDEKLHVRWIKRNGRFPESAVVVGNRLEIEKTSLYDQGVYTCTATNRYGHAEASTRLTVKKATLSSPKVVIRPAGAVISVMEGRSLTLECHVTGISNPSIQWRRLLTTGYIGAGAKLDLNNIKVDETGVYQCSVTTDEGEEKASVSVVVERTDILPRVQVRPNEISVQRGGKATFLCRTTSQLPATITWSRADGSPLGTNHVTRQNHLVIGNITEEDGGTYLCLARNRFGASKATAELTILKS